MHIEIAYLLADIEMTGLSFRISSMRGAEHRANLVPETADLEDETTTG